MKKCFLLILSTLSISIAHADFIFWQVATEYDTALNDFVANRVAGGYAKDADSIGLRLWADNGTSQKLITNINGFDLGNDYYLSYSGLKANPQWALSADVGEATSWSFYVEVAATADGSNYDTIGVSGSTSYADLLSQGRTQDSVALSPVQRVWIASPYSVPEPTSALMLLLGMGALALRRRRV